MREWDYDSFSNLLHESAGDTFHPPGVLMVINHPAITNFTNWIKFMFCHGRHSVGDGTCRKSRVLNNRQHGLDVTNLIRGH